MGTSSLYLPNGTLSPTGLAYWQDRPGGGGGAEPQADPCTPRLLGTALVGARLVGLFLVRVRAGHRRTEVGILELSSTCC